MNASVSNTIVASRLLEFELAFPKENKLSVEEYLKGGSRDIIINAATFFLGINSFNSKYNSKRFLEEYFSHENKDIGREIYFIIRELESEGRPVSIINVYSSLSLFEMFFSKSDEELTQSDSEFELNLFKAYLVLNSEYSSKQGIAISSTDELDIELREPYMLFSIQYPISDKININLHQIWITQLLKSIYLNFLILMLKQGQF
jgi:hypothetical protein